MEEIEVLKHAKSYIDKLANGINPLTEQNVADTDVINNVRISRCLFYVSGILDKVIKSEISLSPKRQRKSPFFISAEEIEKYPYSQMPITISEIARRINGLVLDESVKRLKVVSITQFLCESDYLQKSDGHCLLTQKSKDLGMTMEERQSSNGNSYNLIFYGINAQKYIVENLPSIVKINNKEM